MAENEWENGDSGIKVVALTSLKILCICTKSV